MSSSSEDDTDLEILLNDEATNSTTDEPAMKKRKKKDQAFVDSWLTSCEFKSWLIKKVGANKKANAYCKICEKAVTCSKTGLKRHMASKASQSSTISGMFSKANTRDETATMEIKLCSFIAEHNLPLSISDDFVELLRSLFP